MMDQILWPHQAYAGAYMDDIIIHRANRDIHLRQLRPVLAELRRAGLTANPTKCCLGLEETSYLGYQVGRGNVRPQESKVAAIPGFATLASPLNDLNRKVLPDRVKWTEAAEGAFEWP